MDGGCCSPANRVQWVAIYNIVVGLSNLIYSGYFVGYSYVNYLGGLGISAGVLLLAAGIILLIGLRKRHANYFVAWLVLIILYVIMAMSAVGYDISVLVKHNAYDRYETYTVSAGLIFLLIQGLCIWTVMRYRRNALF